MEASANLYPVTLEVDYPERQSRWKALLRLFLAIPVLIVVGILGGSYSSGFWRGAASGSHTYGFALGAAGSVILVIWVAIVFRGYIPRWLFDFIVWVTRFQTRVFGYFALLTDVYPAFEADYPVRYDVQYPEKPTRWKVLVWKFITSLPHFIVLAFLSIGAVLAVIAAWFAILITGHYPKGLHGYVVGVMRWGLRVGAYLISLTDEYPPFSLSGDAGAAGNDTYVISSIAGVLLLFAIIGGIIAAVVYMPGAKRVDVTYASLLSGKPAQTVTVGKTDLALTNAIDPADRAFPYLSPHEGKRLVAYQLDLTNNRSIGLDVRSSDFRLKDADGHNHKPVLVIISGAPATVTVSKHSTAQIVAIFEVNTQGQPEELRLYAGLSVWRPVLWKFK